MTDVRYVLTDRLREQRLALLVARASAGDSQYGSLSTLDVTQAEADALAATCTGGEGLTLGFCGVPLRVVTEPSA